MNDLLNILCCRYVFLCAGSPVEVWCTDEPDDRNGNERDAIFSLVSNCIYDALDSFEVNYICDQGIIEHRVYRTKPLVEQKITNKM